MVFPLMCSGQAPFEFGSVDVHNTSGSAVTFDYEWRIGGVHHSDQATIEADSVETFSMCEQLGLPPGDVQAFMITGIQPPGTATDLSLSDVENGCGSFPCGLEGWALACDQVQRTFPLTRQDGKQEAAQVSLLKNAREAPGSVTVTAYWNVTSVNGTPLHELACKADLSQCGTLTLTNRLTKLLRFEYPPFPGCSQGTTGGIDYLCVSRVDGPARRHVAAVINNYRKDDPCP